MLVSDLQTALQSADIDSLIYALLGLLDVENANLESAGDYFSKAFAIDDQLAAAYVYRGVYFLALEDRTAAFADFDKAIELDDKLSLAYSYRAQAFVKYHELEQAISDYTTAISLTENNAHLHHLRGQVYRQQNKVDEAIDDFTQVLRLEPGWPEVHLERAELYYYEKQNYPAALDDLDAVIDIDPTGYAYRLRSLAYAALAQTQRARLDRDRAIDLLDQSESVITDGYDIQFNHIWHTAKADNKDPENAQFLVIETDLYNYTDEKLCLNKEDFRLTIGEQDYYPERMYQIKQVYFDRHIQYPPTNGSICIPDSRVWHTFLSYDVPEDVTAFTMTFTPADKDVNIEIWLVPADDPDYEFAVMAVDNVRTMDFGNIIFLDEDIETILMVEPLELDNCNSDAQRTSTRSFSQEEQQQINLEVTSGLDGIDVGTAVVQVKAGIQYLKNKMEGSTTIHRMEREEQFTIPPRSRAHYEIVWSLVSRQGEIEVVQGQSIFRVPFTISDALKVDVNALPSEPCTE